MENAAKALLIAGGSLVAILLLSLFSYLYVRMNESTSKIYSTMAEVEVNEFNQQFWNYNGLKDLKIQDIVSVINLARDSTKQGKNVDVYIKFKNNALKTKITDESTENLIKTSLEKKYKCTSVVVNTSTKLVTEIHFEEM